MCLANSAHQISFQQGELNRSLKDPNEAMRKAARGLSMGDVLRHGRFLTITVLMTAYLGHQANEAKSFTNWSSIVKGEPAIRSWWVVVYALIAYTMFGSRRWMVHRSLNHITKATSTAFQQVASKEALTKIRSTVSMKSIQLFGGAHDDEHCGKRTLSLSVEKPFVSESHVATMTLRDVKDVFQYTFECDTIDFDADAFVSTLRDPARKAVHALDLALRSSRGERVKPHVACDKSSEFGSLDGLAFLGACRIFAEWMPLRLVPDGYSRYAFGMGIARRDLLGNISKVEKVVHAYLDEKVQEADGLNVNSPSIREILEWELATNQHPQRPKLANNTAAQGILWIKRQLQYQTAIFSNTAEIPFQFPDSKAAARAAYEEVYSQYHGFFVKQIFQNSFDAAPSASIILQHMNIPYLKNSTAVDESTVYTDVDDDEDMWIQLPVDQDSIRSLHYTPRPGPPKHPFLDFVFKIARENFMKLGACIGMEGHAHPSLNALSPALGSLVSLRGSVAAATASEVRTSGPDKDVAAYLFALRPFLHGLGNLFEELNMNDPSRV